jgi:hypothetical protein
MRAISLFIALLFSFSLAANEHGGGGGGEGGENKEAAKEAPNEAAKPEEHVEVHREPMAEKPAKQSSRDVKIPRALVAKLEKEYREFLTQQQVMVKEGIQRKLLNVMAELTQKHEASLHENTRVITPLGGGVIDLAELVTPLRGAFSLKLIPFKESGADIDSARVFFVSQAKARNLDGDQFGSGCGKYMEITSYYNKKNKGRGFDLYSTDRRYASVIGGTFVIVNFEKEALSVASVQFTDSRYPDLFCE